MIWRMPTIVAGAGGAVVRVRSTAVGPVAGGSSSSGMLIGWTVSVEAVLVAAACGGTDGGARAAGGLSPATVKASRMDCWVCCGGVFGDARWSGAVFLVRAMGAREQTERRRERKRAGGGAEKNQRAEELEFFSTCREKE